MRVLRLALADGRAVDLHPAVSVVTGLTDAQRRDLRRAFSAIGAGLAPASAGLLEAHGVLLDAGQAELDLLEIGATAATTVETVAGVPGAIPDRDADRLRVAEHDVVRLAGDRFRSLQELAQRDVHVGASPPPAALVERADELRARIARHEERDPEGLRVALDHVRDTGRAGGEADPAELERALAEVGLEAGDLGLGLDELVRLAQDWLEEHSQEAEWAVGAHVELRGMEGAAAPSGDRGSHPDDAPVGELDRRAWRATRTQADAVVRADEVRTELLASQEPRPAADALAAHLLGRLADHRPARLAGAVPLLLDGVLAHLDVQEVGPVLDRVTAAAGPVQVVVVEDHPAARAWAGAAGISRAAVVTPTAGEPAWAPA